MNATFRPVRSGLAVVRAFREVLADAFRWRTETYEFVGHIPAIDLLFGSDRERKPIAAWEPGSRLPGSPRTAPALFGRHCIGGVEGGRSAWPTRPLVSQTRERGAYRRGEFRR